MRPLTTEIDKCRVRRGPLGSTSDIGMNGAFFLEFPNDSGCPSRLKVIVSDGTYWVGLPGLPWEHVSVSKPHRPPSWEEMDFVKRLFWFDDEVVMQLHINDQRKINHNEFTLHLWKPLGLAIPLPPQECV